MEIIPGNYSHNVSHLLSPVNSQPRSDETGAVSFWMDFADQNEASQGSSSSFAVAAKHLLNLLPESPDEYPDIASCRQVRDAAIKVSKYLAVE